MTAPYLICELANSHGGDSAVLLRLVQELSNVDYPRLGVKFQPINPSTLSLPDYEWHRVYKKLYLDRATWGRIIKAARAQIGDVWLDVHDRYAVEIFRTHASDIVGIKLQASVVENYEVYSGLNALDLRQKVLLINISGYEIDEIKEIVTKFSALESGQLVLQVGFQAYPTRTEDTALTKLSVLRTAFAESVLCFADHYDAEKSFACRVPLLAVALGCEFIEKHVCLSRADAEYDFHSALQVPEVQALAAELELTAKSFSKDFISESEKHYLASTRQIPVSKSVLRKGQLVSDQDLLYRRTEQSGLTKQSLDHFQNKRFILNQSIESHTPIPSAAFRRATIGTIVACRLVSSRLKRKALLPIQGVPSVERCLMNCQLFSGVDLIVLATSNLEEDAVLRDHTLNGDVSFWQGHPDDVIHRYVGACDALGIDVVVRVTADCPVVSPEITEFLLERHFSLGADYTGVRDGAVGTWAEIYNADALRRVLELVGKAEYSEYMTSYFRNNPDIFKVEIVDLPPELVRNYRLTLDYQEDLELFDRLYAELIEQGMEPNIRNVFSVLDADGELATHNQHLRLKYKTDPDLMRLLSQGTRIRDRS